MRSVTYLDTVVGFCSGYTSLLSGGSFSRFRDYRMKKAWEILPVAHLSARGLSIAQIVKTDNAKAHAWHISILRSWQSRHPQTAGQRQAAAGNDIPTVNIHRCLAL